MTAVSGSSGADSKILKKARQWFDNYKMTLHQSIESCMLNAYSAGYKQCENDKKKGVLSE